MNANYRVPIQTRLIRVLLRPVFRGIFHLLGRVRITGKENIPYGRPYVVAINHVSLFDPPFTVAFWPETPEAMGAADIWQRPGQDVLVRLYGGIPVHRSEYDREVLDTVIAVLRSGHPLLLAPEGGRSHAPGLRHAKPGVAYIVDETQVPVIPVGIVGTTDDFLQLAVHGKRPQLEMHIGKPIRLPALEGKGEKRRQSRQRNADLIMAYIAGLLPEVYRGVYAESAILPAQAGQRVLAA